MSVLVTVSLCDVGVTGILQYCIQMCEAKRTLNTFQTHPGNVNQTIARETFGSKQCGCSTRAGGFSGH